MTNLFILLMCLLLTSCTTPYPIITTEDNEKEISFMIQLDQDIGQSLGTIFTIYDDEGNPIFGTGFPETFNTLVRDNNRLLNMYFKEDNRTTIQNIGRPIEDATGVRLFSTGEDVIAFRYNYNNANKNQVVIQKSQTQDWITHPLIEKNLINIQIVNNRLMEFYSNRVIYDGNVIVELPSGGISAYINGKLFLFVIGSLDEEINSKLHICDWSTKQQKRVMLSECKLHETEPGDYPYFFADYLDEVIISLRRGDVLSYKKGEIKKIHKVIDGTSWQLYSAVNYFGKLYMGHYPSGSLYVYDGYSLTPFNPPIPVPDGASDAQREAQTLTIFRGDLYVGVWPWAEIWRLNSPSGEWEYVNRAFQDPKISVEEAPYTNTILERKIDDLVYNEWGQRVTSLVPHQNKLLLSTMNKRGISYQEDWGFLTEKQLAQYGTVLELHSKSNMACPFEWQPETILRYRFEESRVLIFQDDKLLCEMNVFTPILNNLNFNNIEIGYGAFGYFGGAEITPLLWE